jgi:hypothetical protein
VAQYVLTSSHHNTSRNCRGSWCLVSASVISILVTPSSIYKQFSGSCPVSNGIFTDRNPQDSELHNITSLKMTAERLLKPWKPRPQKTYIFKNAKLVDPVSGTISPNRTVKISSGVIICVTHTEKDYIIVPSTSETTIDLTGKYIFPGLIESHVHISAVPGEKNLRDLLGLMRRSRPHGNHMCVKKCSSEDSPALEIVAGLRWQ